MTKGLVIFDHYYLYSAYAGDTTFFLQDTILSFFVFFSIKTKLKKVWNWGLGALKGVQVAVCCLRCIEPSNGTLKILGTQFSYDEKLKEEKTFYNTLTDIQWVLKIWKKRNLTLEGKIIFKTIAISTIIFQSFILTVPKHITNELEKIQVFFLWKNSIPKIKCETLCNDYKAGGLKNINIPNKIIALQCSWKERLYDNSFQEWKLILRSN